MSEWIYCDDKMPTEEETYLVTRVDRYGKAYVTMAFYCFVDFKDDRDVYGFVPVSDSSEMLMKNVIAWMPFPAPCPLKAEK